MPEAVVVGDGRLRVGVLGCASIAWRRMLPALHGEPLVDLVAVASRDEAKARRFGDRFDCAAVTGYDPVVERDDLDAVYVSLPAALHGRWATRALAAGKHVLCEKPLTTSYEETAGLVALAHARGLVLAENVLFPFHSQHGRVRELLAAGEIGEVRGIGSGFTVPPRPPADIRYDPALGGGALLDVGVYPLRAAQLLLGPELTVVGATLQMDGRYGVDVSGAILLVSGSGVPAALTFGLDGAYRSSYEVRGSAGRLAVEHAFMPPADHSPALRVDGVSATRTLLLPPDDQAGNAVRAFAEAALRGDRDGSRGEPSLALAALAAEVRERATVRW